MSATQLDHVTMEVKTCIIFSSFTAAHGDFEKVSKARDCPEPRERWRIFVTFHRVKNASKMEHV